LGDNAALENDVIKAGYLELVVGRTMCLPFNDKQIRGIFTAEARRCGVGLLIENYSESRIGKLLTVD
jgi:hypothetical protein